MVCYLLFYSMSRKDDSKAPGWPEDMLKKLGARIKSVRIAKGYKNHERLANQLEISRSKMSGYENGANLTFLTLIKIVRAFDMTLEEFFSEGF